MNNSKKHVCEISEYVGYF